MLETYLSPEDRRFVELRLAEERAALQKFAWHVVPKAKSIHAA